MRRTSALYQRYAKSIRISIQLGVAGGILAAVLSVGFIEYSAQPSFCDNCHIMIPYYESWKSSSHSDVPCIQCHYAPGIKAEAMGKFQAANQVVKYITGTYGLKPWAEIDDAACLRSGCHEQRKLEGEVIYRDIRFDHAQHLGELRRGKRLRCTSCHSQIVQGEHVRVTEATCFLCHFRDRPENDPVAGCIGCHQNPPLVESESGFVVDHPQYVQDVVSCVSCHDQVTSGSGVAEESRCFNCHNEPERLQEFENTELVHRVHIDQNSVECTQCHEPIEHRVSSLTSTFELECGSCHQGVHEEQVRIYAGRGGHGTDNLPSSMFQARVSCQSCHSLIAEIGAHEEVNVAGEASCMACHGVSYANILPAWQDEINQRLETVQAAVRRASGLLGSVPVRDRARADSLLSLARSNLELVNQGKGAHNVAYADRLLRAAVEMAAEVSQAAGTTPSAEPNDLGPALAENACLQCHTDVGRGRGGGDFDHEAHVLRGGFDCATCHTPLDQHGGVTITDPASCNSCHHREIGQLNCATCHEGPGGAPENLVEHPVGRFPHQPHLEFGLECQNCHMAPSMTAEELDCASCHVVHHTPQVQCVNCHQEGVKEKHPAQVGHFKCSQCHGAKAEGITEWSRQVCTTCHVDRVDHNAPVDCVLCHEIPAIQDN